MRWLCKCCYPDVDTVQIIANALRECLAGLAEMYPSILLTAVIAPDGELLVLTHPNAPYAETIIGQIPTMQKALLQQTALVDVRAITTLHIQGARTMISMYERSGTVVVIASDMLTTQLLPAPTTATPDTVDFGGALPPDVDALVPMPRPFARVQPALTLAPTASIAGSGGHFGGAGGAGGDVSSMADAGAAGSMSAATVDTAILDSLAGMCMDQIQELVTALDRALGEGA